MLCERSASAVPKSIPVPTLSDRAIAGGGAAAAGHQHACDLCARITVITLEISTSHGSTSLRASSTATSPSLSALAAHKASSRGTVAVSSRSPPRSAKGAPPSAKWSPKPGRDVVIEQPASWEKVSCTCHRLNSRSPSKFKAPTCTSVVRAPSPDDSQRGGGGPPAEQSELVPRTRLP